VAVGACSKPFNGSLWSAEGVSQEVKVSDAGPCGTVVRAPGAGVRKPPKEETAGRKGALFWLGATYGDLRIAGGASLSRLWRVATVLAARAKRQGAFSRGNGRVWRRPAVEGALATS
jgi:hypothetical protein